MILEGEKSGKMFRHAGGRTPRVLLYKSFHSEEEIKNMLLSSVPCSDVDCTGRVVLIASQQM